MKSLLEHTNSELFEIYKNSHEDQLLVLKASTLQTKEHMIWA